MRKLKRAGIVILLLLALFAGYVEIVNRNTSHMTYRQKVLKAVYPAFMWFTKLIGKNRKAIMHDKIKPPQPFYQLSAVANNGNNVSFEQYRGKKILIVNTASDCGYTNQYQDLQALSVKYASQLVVIGFPANDFKEQEKGSDEEIATFCQKNFGVSFPLMKKSVVIKGPEQNQVYQWLTDSTRNGWNNKAPSWNFSKYLVDEEGRLIHYFDPSVPPLSETVTSVIEKK